MRIKGENSQKNKTLSSVNGFRPLFSRIVTLYLAIALLILPVNILAEDSINTELISNDSTDLGSFGKITTMDIVQTKQEFTSLMVRSVTAVPVQGRLTNSFGNPVVSQNIYVCISEGTQEDCTTTSTDSKGLFNVDVNFDLEDPHSKHLLNIWIGAGKTGEQVVSDEDFYPGGGPQGDLVVNGSLEVRNDTNIQGNLNITNTLSSNVGMLTLKAPALISFYAGGMEEMVLSSDELQITNNLNVTGSATVSGKLVCLADGTNCPPSGSGDITAVNNGTGLLGGGTTGDVSLSVDTDAVQIRVTGTCAAGSSIRVIDQNGLVTCEPDDSGSSIWNLTGNDIYYNNGNVGIGTSTPLSKLSVEDLTSNSISEVIVSAPNPSIILKNTLQTPDNQKFRIISFSNVLKIDSLLDNEITDHGGILSIERDGKVGINTNNPQATLEVVNDGTFDSQFAVGTGSGARTGDMFMVTASGDVGIGTQTPSGKLDVNGTLAVSGTATVAGSQVCTQANGLCATTGTGDITGVAAGTGLTGGGVSGDVTLNANTTYLQRRVANSCPPQTSIQTINADGSVVCDQDDVNDADSSSTNEIQDVIPNQGLMRDASNRFGLINTCADGQILKRNQTSATWYCANDDLGAGSSGIGSVDSVSPTLPGGNIDLQSGLAITITPDDANDRITIAVNPTALDPIYVNEGQSNSVTNGMITADTIDTELAPIYETGSAYDSRFVNVNEPNSVAAGMIQNGAIDQSKLSTTMCANNEILKKIAGSWQCAADDSSSGVNSVTAGQGMTNAGTPTDPLLHVGAGTGITVNADNIQADCNAIIGHACGADNVNDADSNPTNEIQNVIANQGLIRDASNNFGLIDCTNGDVLKNTGAGWACAPDDSGSAGVGSINSVSPFTPGGNIDLQSGSSITITPDGVSSIINLDVDTNVIQNRVSGSCAAGQSIRAINSLGQVTCEVDDAGDNLGNHIATLNLNMNSRNITNANQISGVSETLTGSLAVGQDIAGAGNLDINQNANIGADALVVNSTTGKIGIGTANPTVTLDVNAADLTHLKIYSNSKRVVDLGDSISNATAGGRLGLYYEEDLPNNSSVVLNAKGVSHFPGPFGIGTNEPTFNASLEINGSILRTGSIVNGFSATNLGSDGAVLANYSAVSGGQYNNVTKDWSVISGGANNSLDSLGSAIGGGYYNLISGVNSTASVISGGSQNLATGYISTVGGGHANSANGNISTIGGGEVNSISVQGRYSTISGGFLNIVNAEKSTISGGSNNTVSGNYSSIGGGLVNTVTGQYSAIGGGTLNSAAGDTTTIGGGYSNSVNGTRTTVSGGYNNSATFFYTTVGGGYNNSASGASGTVSGGYKNRAIGAAATISGGESNNAILSYSTVAGGYNNSANGAASTVLGGSNNIASGTSSIAAGVSASAQNNNAAVFGLTGTQCTSSENNQFKICAGQVFIDAPLMMITSNNKDCSTSGDIYVAYFGEDKSCSDVCLSINECVTAPESFSGLDGSQLMDEFQTDPYGVKCHCRGSA